MPPRYSMQGAKGAFFGQGSKQLTPTNMDPSDESAQLVSQMKIELRLKENLCHGNNQTFSRFRWEKFIIKSWKSINEKFARFSSTRANKKTVPFSVIKKHIRFRKAEKTCST